MTILSGLNIISMIQPSNIAPVGFYARLNAAPIYTGQNYGQMWEQYKAVVSSPNYIPPNISSYLNDEDWARAYQEGRTDLGLPSELDREQFKNPIFSKWATDQGIIPLDYGMMNQFDRPGMGQPSDTLDAIAQHYHFPNWQAMQDYMYGPGKTITDPLLGKLFIPNERNPQNWKPNPYANVDTSTGLIHFINAALNKPFGPLLFTWGAAMYSGISSFFGEASGLADAALNAGENWTTADYSAFSHLNDAINAGEGWTQADYDAFKKLENVIINPITTPTITSTSTSTNLIMDAAVKAAMTAASAAAAALTKSGSTGAQSLTTSGSLPLFSTDNLSSSYLIPLLLLGGMMLLRNKNI